MTARFLFRDCTTSCLSAWLRFDALIGFSSKIPSITSPRAHAIGGGFWIESTSTMPLFSLGYAPKIVEFGSQESCDQKWLYVKENPVRAGLVKSAEDWPYGGQITDLPF
jgi:hypothetical protein